MYLVNRCRNPPLDPPGLRVGEFLGGDQLERVDAERLAAAVSETGTPLPTAADEDPDVAVRRNADAGVVVRIVDAALVADNGGPRHYMAVVVVVGDHGQQVTGARDTAAVHEERLPRRLGVNREGHVFGGVGPQATGVFVSEFVSEVLAQGEPDAVIAVCLAGLHGVGFCVHRRDRLYLMQGSGASPAWTDRRPSGG